MTINLQHKSTKTILLAVADELTKSASTDRVKDRRDAMIAVSRKLRILSESRPVTKLLSYME